MIKWIVLACLAVAGFAGPISQTVPLEQLIDTYGSNDQSKIWGNCKLSDRVLYAENVNVKAGILQIKKKDVSYPPDSSSQGGLITCIKIFDQLKTGKNAEITVTKGGLNQRFAVINLQSRRGQPINYSVQFFGS